MAKILRQPVWVNVRLRNSSPVSAEGLFSLQKCTALKVGSWSFSCVIILLIYFQNCWKAFFTRK